MTARDRIAVLVIAGFVAIAGYWFMVLGPKRKESADLGAQIADVQKRLDTANQDVQASEAARASYRKAYSTVAALGKAVPADDDVPSLIYTLDHTADASGVDFRSLKLRAQAGAPAATTNAANAAANTADSGDKSKGSESSNTDATGSSAAPVAPAQTATATLPPGVAVGAAGFPTMPFSFAFEGSFFKISNFLSRLDDFVKPKGDGLSVSGRLLQIDGFTLQAASDGFPHMRVGLSATAYLLPVDEGLTNGASPNGPGAANPGAPTQTSSNGSPAAPAPATATGVGR
jgi:hypothetical protein